MEISGKIIAVLPPLGGTSKNGNEWKKQEYVLETHEQFAKKICFQIFGIDRIAQASIKQGEEVTVHFDIESREYNGKWFTNISAWKVERLSAAASPAASGLSPQEGFVTQPQGSDIPDFPPPSPSDDLPF
jgi:hypothetical protein